mgnify:CR=1 FL=1
MEKQRYFKVMCRCGHVGRYNYIPQSFAVIASSGREASRKARWFPRVQHHKRDAILKCEEISKSEYLDLLEENERNPYFHCKNRQEQNLIPGIYDSVVHCHVDDDDDGCSAQYMKKDSKRFGWRYKLNRERENFAKSSLVHMRDEKVSL